MSQSSVSRSPSPHTPISDSVDQVTVLSSQLERPSWYNNSPDSTWAAPQTLLNDNLKSEDTHMLQLDDLLEQHAYEDVDAFSPDTKDPSLSTAPMITSLCSQLSAATAKPPSSSAQPRIPDLSSRSQRVVHPPQESCYNLPIMFPSIPETGTKSRVETQVRVTIDLADPSSSTDPFTYDRVGSWKWLKLPPGTATKKRTRKQGKIDPEPNDMLYLTTSVTCATPPHNPVLSCSSCQTREAKRVAKKIAARVRPARSDSESPDDPNGHSKSQLEDTTSIIQFNCAEVIEFATGTAVLPLRITCYCRHHREKVGFIVNLAMMDAAGRIVGVGSSAPIMITDDHKTPVSTTKHSELRPSYPSIEGDWSQVGSPVSAAEKRAPSKRKKTAVGAKRNKPYDSSAKPSKASRETSVSSAPSPAPSDNVSLASSAPSPPSTSAESTLSSEPPSLQYVSQESESSVDGLATPLDINLDIPMLPDGSDFDIFSNHQSLVTPNAQTGMSAASMLTAAPSSLPFLFGPPQTSEQPLSMPTIHRLIPNCGPTHGGIEVTVLGANFHPTLQFNCVFGDMPASSTQRWSDNTLVCILPPRATAGLVSVWFEGFPKVEEQPPTFFTYSDESDRALMELALQVVGLKMTGKIEDAKNVAMRIVGAGESSDSQNGNGHGHGQGNMLQMSTSLTSTSTSSPRDLRSLMLLRAGESEDFESLIANFIKLIDTPVDHASANVVSAADAISHKTKNGQSLLHLAGFLGYTTIIDFLVKHDVDLDCRDRNGYTALHFAAMAGSRGCVTSLLRAGADYEIVNALGKTAEEVGRNLDFTFQEILDEISHAESEAVVSDDEEAEWGDAEEEAEEPSSRRVKVDRRVRRSRASSRRVSREELRGLHASSKAFNASATTMPDGKDKMKEKEAAAAGVDEKHALSFIDMLQRTMAQLPGAPHLPQFPLLPGVPAVPWEALHQLPIVFPVAVPLLPGWLSGEHQHQPREGDGNAQDNAGKGVGQFAHEWRALWEKWLAHVPWQATEMPPPPQYTPRASGASEESSKLVRRASASASVGVSQGSETALPLPPPQASGSRSAQDSRRRYDYHTVPVTDQEVNAYAYQPKPQQKKQDRMLLLFWLPILLISLLWACHSGVHFVIRAFRTPMTFKKVLGY